MKIEIPNEVKTCLAFLVVAFGNLHAGAGAATPSASVERWLRRAQVHYDASVAESIHLGTAGDSTGKVVRWDDLTGNGRHLTPNACDGKIVYGGMSTIGGRPVYDLGPAGSCIDLKMASPLTTTRSVVMVAEIDPVLDAFWLGDENRYDFHRGPGGRYAYRNGVALLAKSEGWQDGVKVNLVNDGPNQRCGLSIYVFNLKDKATWQYLGRDRDQAGRNGGKRLAELMTFDFPLDDEARKAIEQHLTAKWSPKPGHLDPLMAAVGSQPDLWDDRKANVWLEAYPIGNGQLGAMVFAAPDQVRLQFNHSRLWTGKPHAYERPNALKALPQIRQLVRERKNREAMCLADREFIADPNEVAKYQPFGDLVIRPRKPWPAAAFLRGLVFRDGMHVYNDGFLSCETFAPYDRPGIIVHHLTTREPVEFDMALSSPHPSATMAADGRSFAGRLCGDGISYAAEIRLVKEDARTLTVYLAAATDVVSPWKLGGDYQGEIAAALADAERAGYAKLRASHLAAWRRLYDRVELQLEGKPGLAHLPSRARLARQPAEKDPAFAKLVFDYGRYLLIAANRPDRSGEATNLQGLWNDQLNPPWQCDMTVNINTQMNYWPAEVCGLGECHLPLMRLLDEIAVSGAKTARTLYGAGGWMAHHNIDLWRGTCPFSSARWGLWQGGGAWLATHIWEHYRYCGDQEFLRQMWPTLRGSVEFFTDALVEYGGRNQSARGQLVTNPSMSPEHGGIREGPAIDMQIVRYLYKAVLAGAKVLGKEDDPLLAKIREQLPRLAPSRIGRWGQLQEWVEDEDDPKNQFGHISHLWAVYPGDEITPETPELYAAARKSLAARGNTDCGSWPACWRICEWARFHDGGKAAEMIDGYLRPLRGGNVFGMNPNLLSCGIFQIDATYGFTAGVAEMLVQSHRFDKNGKPLVELLPALPPNWKNGSVRGLRVRGGGEVSFAWRDGKIVSQQISPVAK